MKAILLALALGVTAAVAQSSGKPVKTTGGEKVLVLSIGRSNAWTK